MTTIIKDVIHRFVHIPPLCKLFIDTPEFNRLRRIKQLGLAYYVYPSAVHTRFEHSIGVMHLAGKVGEVLRVDSREKELLQLAGLLHDVGHVAFSHLMDYILTDKKLPLEIAEHEYRSIQILKKINERVKALSEREVEMVGKMILGDVSGEEKPYLFEIVSNKRFGLDVDRLDYIQRDLYHTGMPCFQADYLLECLRVKNGRLSILKKAQKELEMMYEGRKRLLVLICRHKTTMKAEKIIREAIERLNISGERFERHWMSLDDCRIQCMMEDSCPELLRALEERKWPDVDEQSRFDHISCISREEIDEKLSKVPWTEG